MKGIVTDIDYQKSFVTVETERGYTVFELLGDYEINIEDVIIGNLDSLGGEKLRNSSTGEIIDAFIQNIS